MPQIPPLMIQKRHRFCQFVQCTKFGILTFKFYALLKKISRSVLSGLKTLKTAMYIPLLKFSKMPLAFLVGISKPLSNLHSV